jgi:hypothetical protein
MNMETIFSPCRKYRYTLWRKVPVTFSFDERKWSGPYVQFIGLNPSTANEVQNDPTIRRCIDFASRWGFTQMCMTNLFGFCSAYPQEMMASADPIGENDRYLEEVGRNAGLIVAAWGAFSCAIERGKKVQELFKGRLHHLGLNSDGSPKHPLYLRKDTTPIPFV